MLRRFRSRGPGSVATSTELLDLADRAAVDQALSRLVRQGRLRRMGRGVYLYPEQSRLLGELSPQPDKVVQALAKRGAQRLLPSGAYAANLLGLTDQVAGRIEYLTDGPSARIMVGKLGVSLKRTTTKRLAAAGRVTGTVAEALRFLRREQVDASVIETLRGRLSPEGKQQLLRDIRFVPAWMGKVFRDIAKEPA